MKRFCHPLTFAVAIVALTTASVAGGDGPPTAPEPDRVLKVDPQEVFRSACERLKALEARHAALKGIAAVQPRLQLDDDQRLKAADFVFARNAIPPGKEAARARDAGKPFVYVSVSVWSGHSQQPPADLHAFAWKGQAYQMWVRVFSSDAALVQAVRKTVDEPLLAPRPGK